MHSQTGVLWLRCETKQIISSHWHGIITKRQSFPVAQERLHITEAWKERKDLLKDKIQPFLEAVMLNRNIFLSVALDLRHYNVETSENVPIINQSVFHTSILATGVSSKFFC